MLERGQSLVETSVGLVVLLILLQGLLDLGRVYFIYIALEDGAGEAALYLSLDPRCKSSEDNPDTEQVGECDDPNNALYRAVNASKYDVNWGEATFDISVPFQPIDEPVIGAPVIVRITYPFRPITPLITAIAGLNPIMLHVEARQLIVTKALLPGRISPED